MRLLVASTTALFMAANQSVQAADWVSLLPRDPFPWVDLDSKRTDGAGYTRVQMSLSGNPSSRRNTSAPIKLISKALDCKVENAVFDVDQGGVILPKESRASGYDRIMVPVSDRDLEIALFKRVCLGKRFGD